MPASTRGGKDPKQKPFAGIRAIARIWNGPELPAGGEEAIMKSANADSTVCEYKNDLSDGETFLTVRLKKPVTYKIAKAITDDIVDLFAWLAIRRILIDVRGFQCEISPLEAYLFDQDFEKTMRECIHKQAILVSQADDTHSFFETVTRNCGINTRIFIAYDDAVAWLKG